jgi:tetratricopeptide (TPR) repeat protein
VCSSWRRTKANENSFWPAGYLAAFATTANILIPTGTIMGERLAYLPSAGFCVLAALGWSWLQRRKHTPAWAALAVVVAALAIRTSVRNLDWRDDVSLFSSAAKAAPNSAKVHANLGAKFMDYRLLGPAQTELQAALRINPDYPDALASYGLLKAWLGDNQSAGQMLESALKMSRRDNPHYDYMAVNLAGVWMQTGRTNSAMDLLNREIAESPEYARAWANRAVIRYQRGDLAPARSDAEAALRLDRDNTQAQNLIRLLDAARPGASRQ